MPWWTAVIDATMARPSPKPWLEVRSRSRWKGWKIRSVSAGLMVGPVFVTITCLLPAAVRVSIQM